MKVRTDFHSVNLSTGEKTRSIVGDGQRVDEAAPQPPRYPGENYFREHNPSIHQAEQFHDDVGFIHACHIEGSIDVACRQVFERRYKEAFKEGQAAALAPVATGETAQRELANYIALRLPENLPLRGDRNEAGKVILRLILEAAQPAGTPMSANDMLRHVVGSLRGYPNAGGDKEVMGEVERIEHEAFKTGWRRACVQSRMEAAPSQSGTPEQELRAKHKLWLWKRIAFEMRDEHDRADGHFSTEEVDLVEEFVASLVAGKPRTPEQDIAFQEGRLLGLTQGMQKCNELMKSQSGTPEQVRDVEKLISDVCNAAAFFTMDYNAAKQRGENLPYGLDSKVVPIIRAALATPPPREREGRLRCTCFERADGIGPLNGVHDNQCPLSAEREAQEKKS
jgi:hypothetical protein